MKTCAATLLLLFCTAAGAQTLHKCMVDGKVSYGERPCEPGSGGASSTIDYPAAPAADPKASAELKRMQKEAKALQKDRHQREAADDREAARAGKEAATRHKRCAKLKLDKKWADDEARGAQVQNLERAKVRARQAADRLALECV